MDLLAKKLTKKLSSSSMSALNPDITPSFTIGSRVQDTCAISGSVHSGQSIFLSVRNDLPVPPADSAVCPFLSFSHFARCQVGFMSSSKDAVRCTVHDGAMSIHQDNFSVNVPPQLVKKSQILLDALLVTDPSVTRKITLSVPEEWLRAWAVCYCNEDKRLIWDDMKDLVNCLLVCFSPWNGSPIVLNRRLCRYRIHCLSCATQNTSSLS
jgi:hypothetical protein